MDGQEEENKGMTTEGMKAILSALPGGIPEKILQYIIMNKIIAKRQSEAEQSEGETANE